MQKTYMIYIAGPYSGATPEEIQENVNSAIFYGEAVMDVLGCIPFVPHFFHWWDSLSPKPYNFWLQLDLNYLDRCDVVFRIPGKSSGADIEVQYAEDNFLPVVYSIEELRTYIDDCEKPVYITGCV